MVNEVEPARVLVGFHFFTSTLQRASLGQKVGRYVTDHYFQPVGCDSFSWLEGRGERCDLSQPAEQPARQTRDQSGPPTLRLEPVTGASPR